VTRDPIQPEELLIFLELNWFTQSWADYNLTDGDLAELQIEIMGSPLSAPVMQGTNGLRKLRFAPEHWNTGKSGALRVCYVYFPKYGWVLLCLVFKKGELGNISNAGKQAINKAIERIEHCLSGKYGF